MSDASKIDDGGAAFAMPASEHSQGGHFEQRGLTKRDYFAAAFMAAMLGRADATAGNKDGLSVLFASVAAMSLDAADSLIAASKSEAHHG